MQVATSPRQISSPSSPLPSRVRCVFALTFAPFFESFPLKTPPFCDSGLVLSSGLLRTQSPCVSIRICASAFPSLGQTYAPCPLVPLFFVSPPQTLPPPPAALCQVKNDNKEAQTCSACNQYQACVNGTCVTTSIQCGGTCVGGTCNTNTGTCQCNAGYTGQFCEMGPPGTQQFFP